MPPGKRSGLPGQEAAHKDPDEIRGYGSASGLYLVAGWLGVIPIPPGKKDPPPTGYTGWKAGDRWPTDDELKAWADSGPQDNLALRLPHGVLGIDVDAYGTKKGAETLAKLEAELGALPPTWRSSSRADDEVSGIRFFIVPEGLPWPGKIEISGTSDIETVHFGHRYAIVWPSIHPDGGTYRWFHPFLGEMPGGRVPSREEFTALPEAWVRYLVEHGSGSGSGNGQAAEGLELAAEDLGEMATLWMTLGEPCPPTVRAREGYQGNEAGSRHDSMRDVMLALFRLGHQGHRGVKAAVRSLVESFVDDVTADGSRTKAKAEAEVRRARDGAIEKILANPTPEADRGGCRKGGCGTKTEAPSAEPKFIDGEEFLRLVMVDAPPIWGSGDAHLWAEGESLMLVGPPGVGKSTLAHLLVWGRLGLLDGAVGWPVTPSGSKVLYLAMDRPKQIARAMNRLVRPQHWRTLRERLIVHNGPLPVDLCAEPEWIRDRALEAGAGVVVVDSIKDVLPDASDEKRAGLYNRARQLCLAAGIEWIELHHNRKAGVGNKEPNTLDDVYGSRWLTTGAGSVLSLYGEAGDTVVSLKQLKTPAGEFFPRRVILDKQAGQMSLYEDLSVEDLLAASRSGISARQAAEKLYETSKPNLSQLESARGKLKRLVAAGKAEEFLSEVDGKQRFRAPTEPGEHQRRTNGQSTPLPTAPTGEASSQVRGTNGDTNDINETPTSEGSLREPDVGARGGGKKTGRRFACPDCGHETTSVAKDLTGIPCFEKDCLGKYEEAGS